MDLFLSSVLLAVARNVEFWQEPFYIASHLKRYFRATREHTKVLGIPETGLHVLQFYLCSNLQLNTNNIISPASLEGKKSNAWMLLWEESAVTLFRSDLTQQSLWIPMQNFSALTLSFQTSSNVLSIQNIKIREQYIHMGLKGMSSSCLFRNVCTQNQLPALPKTLPCKQRNY